MKIDISLIRIDGGTQFRSVIDQNLVQQYMEDMKEGDVFPAMLTMFDGVTHWLYDGFHRYQAYMLLGIKEVEIEYKVGSQLEAQVAAFGVNGRHGKPRTTVEKRVIVVAALEHPLTKNASMREIARICSVSHSFVISIKNPETKEKHKEQRVASVIKNNSHKVDSESTAKAANKDGIDDIPLHNDPDDEEMRATELAFQKDTEMMHSILQADDKLNTCYEENKRLNLLVSQLNVRISSLNNEKTEVVKLLKKTQRENEKLKKEIAALKSK